MLSFINSSRPARCIGRRLAVLLLVGCGFFSGMSYALEAISHKGKKDRHSIEEVAIMIKQLNNWTILSAQPKRRGDLESEVYRFKIMDNASGRVRIINFNPNNPNLKDLKP